MLPQRTCALLVLRTFARTAMTCMARYHGVWHTVLPRDIDSARATCCGLKGMDKSARRTPNGRAKKGERKMDRMQKTAKARLANDRLELETLFPECTVYIGTILDGVSAGILPSSKPLKNGATFSGSCIPLR